MAIDTREYLRAICQDCGQTAILDLGDSDDMATREQLFTRALQSSGWLTSDSNTWCPLCASVKRRSAGADAGA